LRHFAVELEELKRALLEMGALVEASIHCSVQALVNRDEGMARRVIEDESCINQMELDIDARVTRLLALNQPVAGDLRLLIIALKINTDLERIGDMAVSIAERAISLSKTIPLKPLIDTPGMALLVEDMLHRSLDSFVRGDAALADTVLPADDDWMRFVTIRSCFRLCRRILRLSLPPLVVCSPQPRANCGSRHQHRRGRHLPGSRNRHPACATERRILAGRARSWI